MNSSLINSLILIFYFFISTFPANAQQVTDSLGNKNIHSKHSINIELGGRSLIIASLNYEYMIRERIALGAGWGFNSIDNSNIIRNNNGITETGDYFSLYSTVNFSGLYFIGKDRHKLILSGGITHFWRHKRINYPSGKIISNESETKWNAGIGYQLTGKHLYLRGTVYCLALPHITNYAPAYIPWLGLTLGYRL